MDKLDIKLFIFDLDGTLVFNEDANYEAYAAAFRSLGMDLSRREYRNYFGLAVEDMLRQHCLIHSISFTEQLLEEIKISKSREYAERIHLIELNSSIVGLLKALSSHFPTALATTARKQNALNVLNHFGLKKYFDFMIFAEDVKQKKPSPECYIKVAEHFKVQPHECMIFEDSPVGIRAGEAFGAHISKVIK